MENDRMNLVGKIEEEEEEKVPLPGFRFHPTEMDTEDRRMSELEKRQKEVLVDHLEGEEEEEEVPLPGFRFHPTDEELVGFYLRRKVEKKKLSIDIIKQVDIYKFDPWDLTKQSTVGVGENDWYFFCLRGRKYRNSVRPNRVTGSGYWKATGIDKKIIFPRGTNNCIGLKKTLVYYCGKGGKGTKTCWMMHEFRLPPKEHETSDDLKSISPDEAQVAENWTICRIFSRNGSSPKKSRSKSTTISTDDTKSTSGIVESNDSGDHIMVEPIATSVAPPREEQNLKQCADEEKWCSSSLFAEILSENQGSSFEFPNVLSDFGDTNWDELGRFMTSSADSELFYF